MPSRQLQWLIAGLLAAALLAPSSAAAAPILLLSNDGRTRKVADPLPAAPEMGLATGRRATGAPAPQGSRRGAQAAQARRSRGPSVRGELRRMLRRGELDPTGHRTLRSTYDSARRTARRLPGRRGVELRGVVALIDSIAASRQLTPSRITPLWLTLERNAQWWREGLLPTSGQRVQFEGSEVLWQYVPGQGLHAHPLANFGRLNGFWQGGRRFQGQLATLLDELLELRVERAGGVAWEYYFDFGPSRAPWVSGMAQGTAVQALTRAAERLSRSGDVGPVVASSLSLFETPPPAGVRVASGPGVHYLLYSGDPGLRVLNGFVQALSGLQTVSTMTGDPRAESLYRDGRAAVDAELAAADTGAWSLYSLGRVSVESTLHYHRLLSEFLGDLCRRTDDALYCETEARFAGYQSEPPVLTLMTRRLRAGATGVLRFRLSKRSQVALRVEHRGRVLVERSLGTLAYGSRQVGLSPPRRRRGAYTVTLTATDLAGNPGSVTSPVEILPPRRSRRGGA